MTPQEMQEKLNNLLSGRSASKAIMNGAIIVGLGIWGGYYVATRAYCNQQFDQNNMNYTLRRMSAMVTKCNGSPSENLIGIVEARVGRQYSNFSRRDQMAAIDYMLDLINSKQCIISRQKN